MDLGQWQRTGVGYHHQAMDPSGRAIVVYYNLADSQRLFMQRYDPAGHAIGTAPW